jgi:hypothetical protein
MLRKNAKVGWWMVGVGLIGLGLSLIAWRYPSLGLPQSDFARGFTLGLFLGMEFLGVVLIKKRPRQVA